MGNHTFVESPEKQEVSGEELRSYEGDPVRLEDLLWEYIERYGFSDSAKTYFENRYRTL